MVRAKVIIRALSLAAMIAGGASAALVAPRWWPALHAAETWLQDFQVALLTPSRPRDERIVVLTITEDTLARVARADPLDRAFLADLFEVLAAAKPRAVGLDLLLDQPGERTADLRLRRILSQYPVPIVVAWVPAEAVETPSRAAYLAAYTDGLLTGSVILLADQAQETIRRIVTQPHPSDDQPQSFAAVIARTQGIDPPTTPMRLDYRRGPVDGVPAFAIYPAHRAAQLAPDLFTDKIVLIGGDLPNVDQRRTPFAALDGPEAGTVPGVVVHAHSLSQLLYGRARPATLSWQRWLLLIATAAAGAAIAGVVRRPTRFATALIGMAGLTVVPVGMVYALGGPVLPGLTPILATVTSGLLIRRYA